MTGIYGKIEKATDGAVFLGVGVLPQYRQMDCLVDIGYVEALIAFGYLDKLLKQEFFDVWLSDEALAKPDFDDPEIAEQYELLTRYAAMDPVIEMPKP